MYDKPDIVIIAGILSYGSKKKIIPIIHKFIIQNLLGNCFETAIPQLFY